MQQGGLGLVSMAGSFLMTQQSQVDHGTEPVLYVGEQGKELCLWW